MKLIIAPGLLPRGPLAIACTLTGESDILKAISHYRPKGTSTRRLGEGEMPKDGENVVAVDGEAAAAMEKLIDPDRLFVMPIPTDAPSSWWGLVGALVEHGPEAWYGWAVNHCREAAKQDIHPHMGAGLANYHKVVKAGAPSIALVADGLADTESRVQFAAILGADFEALSQRLLERSWIALQYFEGLRFDHAPPRVLNIGLHTGWDVPFLIAHLRQQDREGQHIATVDPIGDSYLTDYVRSFIVHLSRPGECSFHKVALESYNGTALLPVTNDGQAMGAANGRLSPDFPSRPFPCITLDEIAARVPFNILKMDTEGAEASILWGGLATIRKLRPQMAISIYHSIAHQWEIPLWCMRHLSGYRYYVRCYSFTGVETLLYAIPDEVETPEGLLR